MSELLSKYRPYIVRTLVGILSVSILSGALVYKYMEKKQTYSAYTSIKFTNNDAKNGYAYDGTLIKNDIEEIKGTEVLDLAIQQAGVSDKITANFLSKHINVEEVIPDDEQKKIDAALDNGHTDYEYNPVEYKISMTSSLPETGKLLNSVANCYMDYYAKNHISKDSFPSDVSATLNDESTYDYIEIADIVRDNIEKMETFLSDKASENGDYHNSENGYSFNDIYNMYDYVYTTYLPKLYATILENKATKNPELLLKKLEQSTTVLNTTTKDTAEDLNNLKSMITSYSEKNKANGSVQSGETGSNYDENHKDVIQEVYNNESNPKSTYDELFTKYISETDSKSMNATDITYNEYLEKVFKDAKIITDTALEDNIEEQISSLLSNLNELYQYAEKNRNEYSEITSASIIKQVNTPISSRNINVKLYSILAMAAVFIMLSIAIPVLVIFKHNIKNIIDERSIINGK